MQEAEIACAGNPPSEWADASVRYTLHLNPGLMARLGIESWAAFKQVPKRGLEIGGILLGRTEVTEHCVHLWIDGYRTVESEHRLGPSYLLSDGDFERLREDVQSSGLEAVGLFRTHTRTRELALDAPDSQLLARCFGEVPALLLLLAPVPKKAAVYARVEGELKCVFECPIDSSLSAILALRQDRTEAQPEALLKTDALLKTEALLRMDRSITQAVPAPAPRRPEATMPVRDPSILHPPPPPPPLPERRPLRLRAGKWSWATIVAIALLSCAAIANGVSHSIHPPPAELSFLRFTLKPAGSSLRLSWDPGAPALKGAVGAVLHVDDGDQQNERTLTAAELQSGAVSYQPHSGNVTFRLDVYPAESKTVGVIQFLTDRPVLARNGPQPAILDEPDPRADPDLRESAKPAPAKAAARQHQSDFRGISVTPLSPVLRSRLHLPASAFGVVVMQVMPASAAYEAAIREGDVIQEVDRRPVAGVAEFEQAMQYASRRAVLLSVERDGTRSFHAVP